MNPDFRTLMAALEKAVGQPPARIPCGCYLSLCPCCFLESLVVTPPGSECNPSDRKHRRYAKVVTLRGGGQ